MDSETLKTALKKCTQRLDVLKEQWTHAFEQKLESSEAQAINHNRMIELDEKIEFEQELFEVINNALSTIEKNMKNQIVSKSLNASLTSAKKKKELYTKRLTDMAFEGSKQQKACVEASKLIENPDILYLVSVGFENESKVRESRKERLLEACGLLEVEISNLEEALANLS